MRRRSFLKSAAAMFPAAGLGAFSFGQTGSGPAAEGVHPVGAGRDRLGETHSLGFSTIQFKVLPRETGSGLFVIEHTGLGHGGPPVHFHLHQDEWFYVMEGEVAFQLGEQRLHLHAGESVLGPRRVPHTFSSMGAAPSRVLLAFCPAGKMEHYFRDIQDPKVQASDAEVMRRYDMERIGPSPFWKS